MSYAVVTEAVTLDDEVTILGKRAGDGYLRAEVVLKLGYPPTG